MRCWEDHDAQGSNRRRKQQYLATPSGMDLDPGVFRNSRVTYQRPVINVYEPGHALATTFLTCACQGFAWTLDSRRRRPQACSLCIWHLNHQSVVESANMCRQVWEGCAQEQERRCLERTTLYIEKTNLSPCIHFHWILPPVDWADSRGFWGSSSHHMSVGVCLGGRPMIQVIALCFESKLLPP